MTAKSKAVRGQIGFNSLLRRVAVAAGLLRRLLPDHICEPLNVHALLPARQFVPAKVRCFLDALEAHTRSGAAAEVEA